MYNLFSKIHEMLTSDFIKEKTGYDLSQVDPEKTFFHPYREVDRILKLVDEMYKKKFGEVENIITSNIDTSDIGDATKNGRCKGFEMFWKDMTSY